jgi:glycosyltransferase involved in cell wall biosynthesis
LCFLDAIKLLVERSVSFKVSWFGHTQSKAYYQQCLSKVQDLNLREYISFYPPIERIEEEYRKVDLFCLPSLYEGTPNCVCEAMASGLPIVCSDVCDNSRIVENGQNGFLYDPNSQKISQAVENLLNFLREQKIEWEDSAEAGRKKIFERKILRDIWRCDK